MALFEKMTVSAAGRTPLWLDDADYAGALLAGGAPPWLDASACVAWRRKAQSLLPSDVITLPLGAVIDAWIAQHESLRQAMSARQRTLYPLKVMLADPALRAHLADLARALRASFADSAFALTCPSPRLLAAYAWRESIGGEDIDVSDDDVDAASVYMADFLREFGESVIDAVLLIESVDTEPADAAALSLYQSVINVAGHYRWDLGCLAPRGRCTGDGLSFVIAPESLGRKRCGVLVHDAFWRGEPPPESPPNGFRYAVLPADLQPEAALTRLAVLRQ